MSANSLTRYRINLRAAVPEEAALMRAADSGATPAAVFLRGAAVLGHALLTLGIRPLEDGTLLVPTATGVRMGVSPEALLETLQRGLLGAQGHAAVSSALPPSAAPAVTAGGPVERAAAPSGGVVAPDAAATAAVVPAAAVSPAVPAAGSVAPEAAPAAGAVAPPPSVTETGPSVERASADLGPVGFVDDRTAEEIAADQERLHSEMIRSLGFGMGA